MVTIVQIAMKLAPYGVAALLFEVVGSTGFGVLMALGAYGLVVLAGLLVHIALVYSAVVRLLVKLPLFAFLRAIRAALLLAFSTSSSSATLPVTKQSCELNLGVSKQVTSFVLPIGATVNLFLGPDSATLLTDPEVSFVDEIFVLAAPTLASIASDTISTGYQEITIDSADVHVLEHDTLYIGTQIILEDSNGLPVKLTASDYVTVIGRVEVEYRFDGDF